MSIGSGFTPEEQSPPGAVVFKTGATPFAIRKPQVDLEATSRLGWGVSLWIAVTDADRLHEQLVAADVPIVLPPAHGPFGRFFAFQDPDGYTITVHTKQPEREKAIIDSGSGYLTFINTFTVEPQNAEKLVENLKTATEAIFRDQPGFISANLHMSHDRRTVVNYAQWRSKAAYDAMSHLPDVQKHMKHAAALATSFEPADYDLVHVIAGRSS
jgi:quinol monooxygenase YgiN